MKLLFLFDDAKSSRNPSDGERLRMVEKHLFILGLLLSCIFISFPSTFAASTADSQQSLELTDQMLLLMGVLVFVILLFVKEWVRVDVVGIMMMVMLPLLGLVTPEEAISGLSSNAVVSIIAVIIIGAGLDKTGVMNIVARYILQIAGRTEGRIIALIGGTVALISSFMQNIGAAALFMPATIRVSRQVGISPSRVLMPMGFCAIVGGTITLVGASPTILLNDLLAMSGEDLEPFSLFTQTPIGLALVLSAVLYFVVLGKFILPKTDGETEEGIIPQDIIDTYHDEICSLYELHIPENFKNGMTLQEMHVRTNYHVAVVGISHTEAHYKNLAPTPDEKFFAGDDIALIGCPANVERFVSDLGLILKKDLQIFAEDLSPNNAGILEGIITPRSELAGKTMGGVCFRKKYRVTPVVLCQTGKCTFTNLTDVVLRPGDAVLLFGRWEEFHRLKKLRIVSFTTDVKGEMMRTEKAKLAVGWLAVALTLILVFDVRLSIALLAGALGMIVTRVMSIDEAYQSVDWMTVFLLAGLIPLGLAFQDTGTAAYIATGIMNYLGTVPPIVFLAVIGILTSFFTLVVSNVGATVLLVPLAISMAYIAGTDPRMAALVVALSASNTFILPTHQVNALVMRPGGYKTVDYTKAGVGMTILFLVVMLAMIYLFY
jgi:di/tricarboxylate transporter